MKQERVERVRPKKTRPHETVEEIDAVLEDQSMLFEFRQRPGQ